MKNKELRERAGEIAAKLDVLSLQCRQEGRAPNEEEQRQFVELKTEAQRYITEAEGLELLDGYEGEKLSRLKRGEVSFNTHVNTREKANLDLAVRSFLGKPAGISNPEWDAHAEQFGMTGRTYTRAWSTSGSGTGAEFVPTNLGDTVYRKLLAYGGLLNYLAANGGTFSSANGDPFNFPEFDATGLTGSQLSENSADSAQSSLASSSKAFSSYCYTSGMALISHQSIRDSKFPIVDILSSGLAEGLGRAMAAKLISGTGSSQPEGLLQNVVSGATAADVDAFTYDELLTLMFSVNEPHASNGVWITSRDGLRILFGLVDGQGRPLFLPSIREGQPATLIGRPIYVDLNMPTVAAGHTPIVFGDVARGFKARMVGDLVIRSSDDRYFEYNQTAVVANQYFDSRAVDLSCYKALTMAAS